MRLTNQFSIMGRKYDLAYGQASIWKRKLKNDRYELIENAIDKLGQLEDILEGHNIETLEELDGLLWYVKQIKNIEEKLGIDLITFHRALKNGVYYKVINKDSPNYGKIFFDKYILWSWDIDSDGNYFAMMQSQIQTFNLKDYGKTWALDKGELEK